MPPVIVGGSSSAYLRELIVRRVLSCCDLLLRDQHLAADITLSEAGEGMLDTASQSIIGAINELVGAILETSIYGSLYMYDAAQLETINAANEYHSVIGYSQGIDFNGFSFVPSLSGVITNTANNAGILRCTDAGHGLSTGDYINSNGMSDPAHVDTSQVTVIDSNTFDCNNIAFSSIGDTGFWQRGSGLKLDPGHDGIYSVEFNGSLSSVGNNKNYKFELVKNITHLDEIAAERKIAVGNDLGSLSAGGYVELVAGDVIWLQVENTTDSTDWTMQHANLRIHRL